MDASSSTKPLDAFHRQMVQFWHNAGTMYHLGLDQDGDMEAQFVRLVRSLEETSITAHSTSSTFTPSPTSIFGAETGPAPRNLSSAPWAVKNIMLDSMDAMERHLKLGMAGFSQAIQQLNSMGNLAATAPLTGLTPNKDMAVRAVEIAIAVSRRTEQLRTAYPGSPLNNSNQTGKVSLYDARVVMLDVREEYWGTVDTAAAADAASPFELLRLILPERAFSYSRPVPDENMDLLVCVVAGWAIGSRAMSLPATRLRTLSLAEIRNLLVLSDTLLHRQRPLVPGGLNGVPPPVMVPSTISVAPATSSSSNENTYRLPGDLVRSPLNHVNNGYNSLARPAWAGPAPVRPILSNSSNTNNNSNHNSSPAMVVHARPPLCLPPRPYHIPPTSRHYTPPPNHSKWAVVSRRAGAGPATFPPISSWNKVSVKSKSKAGKDKKKGKKGKKARHLFGSYNGSDSDTSDSDSDSDSDAAGSAVTGVSNSDSGSEVVLNSDSDASTSTTSSGSFVLASVNGSDDSDSDSDSDGGSSSGSDTGNESHYTRLKNKKNKKRAAAAEKSKAKSEPKKKPLDKVLGSSKPCSKFSDWGSDSDSGSDSGSGSSDRDASEAGSGSDTRGHGHRSSGGKDKSTNGRGRKLDGEDKESKKAKAGDDKAKDKANKKKGKKGSDEVAVVA